MRQGRGETGDDGPGPSEDGWSSGELLLCRDSQGEAVTDGDLPE